MLGMIVVSAPWALQTFDALVSPTRFLNSPITPSQTHFPRIIRRCFMIKNFVILVQLLALKIRRFFFVKLAFNLLAVKLLKLKRL